MDYTRDDQPFNFRASEPSNNCLEVGTSAGTACQMTLHNCAVQFLKVREPFIRKVGQLWIIPSSTFVLSCLTTHKLVWCYRELYSELMNCKFWADLMNISGRHWKLHTLSRHKYSVTSARYTAQLCFPKYKYLSVTYHMFTIICGYIYDLRYTYTFPGLQLFKDFLFYFYGVSIYFGSSNL